MAVKKISSGGRILAVLEEIARRQPVGVSALARLLGDDKTAIQRALATLAEHGWIRPEPGRKQAKWELTPHIHAVARMGHESSSITKRARPVLKRLRDAFDETILLTVPGLSELVLVDMVESHQMLKYAPTVGLVVPLESAARGCDAVAYEREMAARYAGRRTRSPASGTAGIGDPERRLCGASLR